MKINTIKNFELIFNYYLVVKYVIEFDIFQVIHKNILKHDKNIKAAVEVKKNYI